MAKKRKVARKAKARKTKVDVSTIKRKRDEAALLKLAHGVISGAYADVVEQAHPDGYDEERLAKRKTKVKAKKKVAKAKKKAASKRKVARKK